MKPAIIIIIIFFFFILNIELCARNQETEPVVKVLLMDIGGHSPSRCVGFTPNKWLCKCIYCAGLKVHIYSILYIHTYTNTHTHKSINQLWKMNLLNDLFWELCPTKALTQVHSNTSAQVMFYSVLICCCKASHTKNSHR